MRSPAYNVDAVWEAYVADVEYLRGAHERAGDSAPGLAGALSRAALVFLGTAFQAFVEALADEAFLVFNSEMTGELGPRQELFEAQMAEPGNMHWERVARLLRIAVGAERNGSWDPWSGVHAGGRADDAVHTELTVYWDKMRNPIMHADDRRNRIRPDAHTIGYWLDFFQDMVDHLGSSVLDRVRKFIGSEDVWCRHTGNGDGDEAAG